MYDESNNDSRLCGILGTSHSSQCAARDRRDSNRDSVDCYDPLLPQRAQEGAKQRSCTATVPYRTSLLPID